MRGRRLLLVVAVLMGLTALAASLVPRDPVAQAPRTPGAPPPPAPPRDQAERPADGEVTTVKAVFSATKRGREPKRVVAEVGDLVEVSVSGDVVDSVSVDGLTDVVPIDPESPAQMQLLADEPGVYPVTLLQAQRLIGRLDVRAPAQERE
jgi:hypothetical protein